jgi:hypothetical protein
MQDLEDLAQALLQDLSQYDRAVKVSTPMHSPDADTPGPATYVNFATC